MGGLLDGVFQVIGDWASGLCLSPHQFFWRGMVALGFGLVGAAAGLLLGGAATVVFGSATLVGGITIAGTIAFAGSLVFVLGSHGVKSDMLKWITKEMDW